MYGKGVSDLCVLIFICCFNECVPDTSWMIPVTVLLHVVPH